MSEISKYEAQKKKLDGLCEEHDLTYRFRHDVYPITLTIRPIQGVGEQLSLLEADDTGDYMTPDSFMVIYRKDGELAMKVNGKFTISETLRSKFKNIYLKLADFWLQYFFRDLIEGKAFRHMPVIDEDEANDSDEPSEDLSEEDDEEMLPSDGKDPDEDMITAATLLVRQENKASVSLLQRRLKIGYAKAARLMDMLEERGVVGKYNGAEPREVLPADLPDE